MNNKEQNEQHETKEKIEKDEMVENNEEGLEDNNSTKTEGSQNEADSTEEEIIVDEEEKLQEEIRSLKEDKIRVLAEMENLRKRFPKCDHKEAVFFSLTTPEGMSLYFQCLSCANKWKDEGGEI